MLIVGTIIGAGFASGREIVSFFGIRPSVLAAVLSAVLIFLFCLLFLKVGSKVGAGDIGTVNRAIAGRADVLINIAVLFNCAVSLSAMLSGMNSLFDGIKKLSPLYAVVAAILSVAVVSHGLKGLLKASNILVPLLIAVMAAVCVAATVKGGAYNGQWFNLKIFNSFTYVGMNMFLTAAVLTTVKDTTKQQRVGCALLTALILGGLMLMFIVAYNKNSVGDADMPLIALALKYNKFLYGFSVGIVAFAVFTTLLTAHLSLTEWFKTLGFKRVSAAVIVAVLGLACSFLGFKTVVNYIYPVVGVIGVLFTALCLHYLIKGTAPAATHQLFNCRNRKIHQARKHAKHHNRRHDEVDLKHLTTVDN